ncbi:hypothetical protein BDN72DRAFT_834290 [Pluteus cervinus]|uniref:Uncharacterized protein n=1 Tax=Pluteus cervinus TaxID=181527 RepID=A0ACD3B787_9AGAR|nr:hypothetical protein BDN72DRAFT_834290 [Pluteus cervinus]
MGLYKERLHLEDITVHPTLPQTPTSPVINQAPASVIASQEDRLDNSGSTVIQSISAQSVTVNIGATKVNQASEVNRNYNAQTMSNTRSEVPQSNQGEFFPSRLTCPPIHTNGALPYQYPYPWYPPPPFQPYHNPSVWGTIATPPPTTAEAPSPMPADVDPDAPPTCGGPKLGAIHDEWDSETGSSAGDSPIMEKPPVQYSRNPSSRIINPKLASYEVDIRAIEADKVITLWGMGSVVAFAALSILARYIDKR